MPTLTDPAWLRDAHAGIAGLASDDLSSLWSGLDLSKPRVARDLLLEHVPAVTATYGQAAAVVAADWYDESRSAQRVPGRFRAVMAPTFPSEYVRKRIRFGAAHLFTETPQLMLPFLLDSMQEYVLQPGRDSILRSVATDREAKGWERVTRPGACDFCHLLSGRFGKTDWVNYPAHGNCNCTAQPIWR